MAVDLKWHPTLPVLVATYTGMLTAKTYRSMEEQRRTLLDSGPQQVVLLANMQELEGVRDPDSFDGDPAGPFDARIISQLVVLPEDLYRRVMRAVNADEQHQYPVQFFSTLDSALDAASRLTKG